MNTFTKIAKQKEINKQIDVIVKWIKDVNGHNPDETEEFIYEHLLNLNDLTKKSLYEHILDKTDLKLIEVNKKNDLMIQIEQLVKLIK